MTDCDPLPVPDIAGRDLTSGRREVGIGWAKVPPPGPAVLHPEHDPAAMLDEIRGCREEIVRLRAELREALADLAAERLSARRAQEGEARLAVRLTEALIERGDMADTLRCVADWIETGCDLERPSVVAAMCRSALGEATDG